MENNTKKPDSLSSRLVRIQIDALEAIRVLLAQNYWEWNYSTIQIPSGMALIPESDQLFLVVNPISAYIGHYERHRVSRHI